MRFLMGGQKYETPETELYIVSVERNVLSISDGEGGSGDPFEGEDG